MASLWRCRAQVSERCVKDKEGPVCRMCCFDADVDMMEESKAEFSGEVLDGAGQQEGARPFCSARGCWN